MKPPSMSVDDVLSQLETWGSESVRKIYARQGAGDNQYGVPLGKLRPLAKKLKTNHPLALQLWDTGNADARVLATMLLDPAQLTKREAENMVKRLTYAKLVDELVDNVLAKTSYADALRARWQNSTDEFVGGRVGSFCARGSPAEVWPASISTRCSPRSKRTSCRRPSASRRR